MDETLPGVDWSITITVADISDCSIITELTGDKGEHLANASLIAAAPELYEALVRLREWLRNPGADDSPENEAVIDMAEAAIAKVEGRAR